MLKLVLEIDLNVIKKWYNNSWILGFCNFSWVKVQNFVKIADSFKITASLYLACKPLSWLISFWSKNRFHSNISSTIRLVILSLIPIPRTLRNDCPARITFALSDDQQGLKIASANLSHNHNNFEVCLYFKTFPYHLSMYFSSSNIESPGILLNALLICLFHRLAAFETTLIIIRKFPIWKPYEEILIFQKLAMTFWYWVANKMKVSFFIVWRLACPKKHQSCLIKLQMQILVPYDLNTMPDFFKEF